MPRYIVHDYTILRDCEETGEDILETNPAPSLIIEAADLDHMIDQLSDLTGWLVVTVNYSKS